jgi:DMSO reductase family type II enzyme heme b subunit
MEARLAAGLGVEALLDPDGQVWSGAGEDPVQLIGTPAGLQPTAAIRNTWMNRKIGAVERVQVRALHDGEVLALRLEWEDVTRNDSQTDTLAFADAAAIAFPAAPGAQIATMGAPEAPVNAWYWRADEGDRGRQLVAEGIGETRPVPGDAVRVRGTWKQGRWRLVIARALRMDTREPVVQLAAGAVTHYGVAVWDGANQERGGIKAFSGAWRELRLAPEPMARR